MKYQIVVIALITMALSGPAFASFQDALNAYNAGDYETARVQVKQSADQGSLDAQLLLGYMYENGQGVSQDYGEATKWYRKAAEQGHANAQDNLGVMYDHGQGVSQDYGEAVKWFRKAAEQGYARAQYNLGIKYDNGQGVSQDYGEAAKWFRKAAEQGHAGAQHNLGVMYDNGQGVSQDYGEAAKWYRNAAEQGHAGAQNNLGVLYFNGDGVMKDRVRGMKWYILAARNGNEKGKENVAKKTNNLEGWIISDATIAADAFRKKPLAMTPQEEAIWLKTYRRAYNKAKTYDELWTFIYSYEDDDPDGLVPKARFAANQIEKKQEEQKAKQAQRRAREFRNALKPGTDTHCGMAISIKKPLVKVQTMVGEKWFRLEQLYPKGEASCRFYNGEYVEP